MLLQVDVAEGPYLADVCFGFRPEATRPRLWVAERGGSVHRFVIKSSQPLVTIDFHPQRRPTQKVYTRGRSTLIAQYEPEGLRSTLRRNLCKLP
jgi:hypothetical protein